MAKLNERELKVLKSEVFWEQLGYLSDELGDPGRYFPFLKSKSVLEQGDCESIRTKSTAREKVDEFVTIIHNRESSKGESAFDVFVEALKSQKVQAHIARSLLRAFAKRKNETEGRKGADSQVEVQTQLQQTVSPPVIRESPLVSSPIQATSNSHSTFSNGDVLQASVVQLPIPVSSPSQSYDQHPEYGPLPPQPPQLPNRQDTPVAPVNEDLDPQFGLLPPPPPRSGTRSTSPRLETGGEHPCDFEPGVPPILQHEGSPILYSARYDGQPTCAPEVYVQQLPLNRYRVSTEPTTHDLRGQYGSMSESSVTHGQGRNFVDSIPNESPQTEQKYKDQLMQQMGYQMQLNHNGESTEEQAAPRWSDLQLQRQLQQRDAEIKHLQAEMDQLHRENNQLRSEVRDYNKLRKEFLDVEEKLKNVTLSYHEHNYKTLQQSASELDDYADLQEESGRLQKTVAEQHSQLEVLQREKKELKLQADEYQQENQQLKRDVQTLLLSFSSSNPPLQSRPHHLPISVSLAGSQYASLSHEHPTVGDTPISLTPIRSMHVGDHLSRHNIHLQQPISSPLAEQRHSVGSGEDTLSLRSSSTSLSSHSSTISKTSVGLALSGPSTTTLV